MNDGRQISGQFASVDEREAKRNGASPGRPIPAKNAEARPPHPELGPKVFQSIFGEAPEEIPETPACFVDLNLDQIIAAVTAGREEYELRPFFHASLHGVDAIHYRHEVFRDLESEALFEFVTEFTRKMRQMREQITKSGKLYYKYQKERLFLDAVSTYCEAVAGLARDLGTADLRSRGFVAFREFLAGYIGSAPFASLRNEAKGLYYGLSTVKYCMNIKGTRIRVRKPESEIDYSAEVERTFEKFKRGAVKSYLVEFRDTLDMNHIEAAVLGMVAKLYPDVFLALSDFCARNAIYLDPKISAFDREVQFYIGYLQYIERFKHAGLSFCYPRVSASDKAIGSVDGFDLALAGKLIAENTSIVCNDFHLQNPERIFVVTGPNQGGKTTFARTFGQLHFLASVGCPVPGREASLFLFDKLFTHFEKEEDIHTQHGKLEEDLIRIHDSLGQATPNSIVIMNEIFTSTTLHDALFLGKKVVASIAALDALCVCVTFVDELASLNEKTVSLVSTVGTTNSAERTYKIVRKPADGRAYAMAIARRHRLAYDDLKERLRT
ncbi:DNA mismatch repair protein MutS [Mesorhizobium sp. dw_380]|uniref:MutS-related protein n=1 Tax=Mesorhizobium sp. dw_380 TaxID=2812001 RepID=UPI001BDDEB86|nr:DNA mismatch repair protein MutS [Mesorhizobium sp. dw_380]